MGGVINGRLGISSTLSPQQSSDLEKTQVELRQTFTAAEKFRRELEFLQKGGDPLDLKTWNALSLSVQSTSLLDQHPEQFVTSEAKGSFAVTASHHGDSAESSGRLGAPSVCEPNSADNLMLFDGDNKFHKVERRSVRPPTNNITPSERYSELDSGQNARESGDSAALELPKKSYKRRIRSRSNRDGARLSSTDAQRAKNVAFLGQTNGYGTAIPTKGLDSESSCTQIGQSLDVNNENELPSSLRNMNDNGTMEQILGSNEVLDMEGNDLLKEKEGKSLNIANNNNLSSCHWSHIEVGSLLKEEEDLKNPVLTEGVNSDGCISLETESKPCNVLGSNLESIAEQNVCPQNNLNLIIKEHEDPILKEARIIEAKRKRIAELSVDTLPQESRRSSHWDFVLEEMSWLANDFAQERLWKVTAAAQISRSVAFTSQIRFQQQNSLRKQKEVTQTLSRAVMVFWHMIQVKYKELEHMCLKTDSKPGLQGYAMRFLEYNSCDAQYTAAQVPPPSDMICDVGIIDISWEDNLTEENLFYTVPPGAIEAYRKSIESHLIQCESGMQEEVDTSGYDAVADNAFEEDDGETRAYYLPGAFQGSKSSKAAQKRRKNFKLGLNTARSYETGANFPCMQSVERNIGIKRPGSSLNVSIPTKRVRTASRQRVVSPYHAGISGCVQGPNRSDASSGDTNSFPDKQSSLPNTMEAESVGDYEKQLQFDSVDVPDKPKKKKKAKHMGSSLEYHWQLDSNFQNDQKDHSKRRLDTHQFDSNGSNVPHAATSQMSNMSNPKKFMELLVRDRGRKSKTLKTPVGQPGSRSPWSLFEDQALVVLVHDMGPNWELISDAINSTLQFKCIFRKPKECKERHKMLIMDRNTGDGADSAEDSGSSQPYSSTLPGIPEGSARQLFHKLQGPMEEDTLKSHFEKIIMIGQKQYYRTKNDNHDPKQLQQPHSSHTLALSQVCPNNLNGGPVLTPFELCDAIAPSPDVPPAGYQGPHSGGLPISNQGNGAAMPPGSSSSSSTPGSSSNVVLCNNSSSASASPNPSAREGRYGIPRTGSGSLSKEDQQRMQQYNQMLSARNMQQPGLPPGSHSGTERPIRMLPTGNGIGVMPGTNINTAMTRPGFQGVLSGTAPGQGNSMLRPRDDMHLIRPNQNNHQRQIMPAELQMQQGVSSSFSNPATQSPVPPYPQHHRQPALPVAAQHPLHIPPNHPINPPFTMRLIKERQLQQQRLIQQRLPQNTTPPSPPVLPPPPPHGLVQNYPQTGGKMIAKQQFPLYSGPLNTVAQAASKTFSGQTQAAASKKHAPPVIVPPVVTANNHHHPQPPAHRKLLNLSQATNAQRMLNKRVVNLSEPPFNNSPVSKAAAMPPVPCTDATSSETPVVGAKWQQLPSS